MWKHAGEGVAGCEVRDGKAGGDEDARWEGMASSPGSGC